MMTLFDILYHLTSAPNLLTIYFSNVAQINEEGYFSSNILKLLSVLRPQTGLNCRASAWISLGSSTLIEHGAMIMWAFVFSHYRLIPHI